MSDKGLFFGAKQKGWPPRFPHFWRQAMWFKRLGPVLFMYSRHRPYYFDFFARRGLAWFEIWGFTIAFGVERK